MTSRVNKIAENGGYQSIDEFMEELLLVFENATIYNEPGSTIYQDALILHKVAIDSLHLVENGNPQGTRFLKVFSPIFELLINFGKSSIFGHSISVEWQTVFENRK